MCLCSIRQLGLYAVSSGRLRIFCFDVSPTAAACMCLQAGLFARRRHYVQHQQQRQQRLPLRAPVPQLPIQSQK